MKIKLKIGHKIDHQIQDRLGGEDDHHLVDDDPRPRVDPTVDLKSKPGRDRRSDGGGADRNTSPTNFQTETDCSNGDVNHSSGSSAVSDGDDGTDLRSPVNLLAFLTGWSRRDRRGRRYADPEEEDVNVLKTNLVCDSDHTALVLFKKRRIECTDPKRFECQTCNKTFSSFQALGGHRSSHSKVQIVDKSRDEQQQQREHRCRICNKSFSSGQALGGHQRRHWAGPSSSTSNLISARQSSGDEVASQITTTISFHRNLLFDLNEPPPMEDDAH